MHLFKSNANLLDAKKRKKTSKTQVDAFPIRAIIYYNKRSTMTEKITKKEAKRFVRELPSKLGHLAQVYDAHDEATEHHVETTPTTYRTEFQKVRGVNIVVHTDTQIPDAVSDNIQDDLFDQIDILNPQPQKGLFLLRVRVVDNEMDNAAAAYVPWVSNKQFWRALPEGTLRAGIVQVPRTTIDDDTDTEIQRAMRHELWHAIDDIFRCTPEMQDEKSEDIVDDDGMYDLVKELMVEKIKELGREQWLKSGIIQSVYEGMKQYLEVAPEDFVHRMMAKQYGVEPYTDTAYHLSHQLHTNIAINGIQMLKNIDQVMRDETGGDKMHKHYFKTFAGAVLASIDNTNGYRPQLVKELRSLPGWVGKYFR